ncbi:hypothetical protein ONZ45_g10248 [Pleurotus djamor]|nr:hypothetical protein ONZ45_g10248 [Pleurotus djamor]
MPHSPSFPKQFSYKWTPTFRSTCWWLWLQTPHFVRSWAYCCLLRAFGRRDISRTYRLPFGIYVKFGLTPNEPLVMDFVRKHTSIPVPTVFDVIPTTTSFGLPDMSHDPFPESPKPWLNPPGPDGKSLSWMFVMTEIPGRLMFEWGAGFHLTGATDEQIVVVKNTLGSWVRQLQDISPPPDFPSHRVSGFLGDRFKSYRISEFLVGPYRDTAEFHSQDFCTVWDRRIEDEAIRRLVDGRPLKEYRICLTHGDIVPHNIVIDEACRPVGLIDWETAGWMPEYWDTAMSSRFDYRHKHVWNDIVREAFPRYDDDLTLEALIQLDYDP